MQNATPINLPIYVINLDRSLARRQGMQAQLNFLGLDYEIVSAVDGMKLSPLELSQYSEIAAIESIGKPLVNTQIGCALSHLKLYARMIEQNIPECAILEDDIYLGQMFREVLLNRNKFPADWELINFCTDARQEPFGDLVTDIYRCSRLLEWANRTSAYLINISGAKKLHNKGYPIRYEADGLTGRTQITDIKSYSIWPPVIALQDVGSEIWNAKMIDVIRPKGFMGYVQRICRYLQRILEPLTNPSK